MFQRTRRSLKQRNQRNQQTNHRTTQKQKGGAAWSAIPPARQDDWKRVTPTIIKDISFTTIFEANRTDLSSNVVMEEYLSILERQDTLFEVALAIIKEKCGVATREDILRSPATLNGRKAEMMGYLDDAEALINFTVDRDIVAALGATKLQSVRGDTESLTTLLLYPNRLSNIFVNTLANIFIFFKKNPAELTQLADNALLDLAVAQYQSDVEANAFFLTARKLRDGFFLNQGADDFSRDMTEFWPALFRAMLEKNTKVEADIFDLSGCVVRRDAPWAEIASHVFLAHRLGKIGAILDYFKVACGPASAAAPRRSARVAAAAPDRKFIPGPEYDTVSVRGTTLQILMSHMADTTLQFILHLAYSIRIAEANSPGTAAPVV